MQKPFGAALRIEISGCLPQPEIRKVKERGNRGGTEIVIGCWFNKKVSHREHDKAHAHKTWNDAIGAIVIKVPNTEFALGQSPRDNGRHEIAGNHKKNIHSNKSARHEIDLVMKEDHRGHRKRPQG